MRRAHKLILNGRPQVASVKDNTLLLDYLRESCRLGGTKRGCDGGECGACTVLVDGRPRLACLTRVGECAGRQIETIEALGADGRLGRLQEAFHRHLGTQCGFCAPGMIMAAEALLRRNSHPSRTEIREALSGNLCRCTGYVKIIESVEAAIDGDA